MGDLTENLLSRRQKAVSSSVFSACPIFANKASGSFLWDVNGDKYIDFASGISTLNVGHRHPKVMAAVKRQLESFTHTCFSVVPYESYIQLAERLNDLVPGSNNKSIFFTTGAEAVENAVKIARVATGRDIVISFTGAFHGRTYLTSGLTGRVNPYKKGLRSSVPNIFHLPYPIPLRGVSVSDAIHAIDLLFTSTVDPDSVAAILIEPVLGEGGFYPADRQFLRHLRDVCYNHGIVFVVDEVQTGFGRTGKMFAIEHSGVEPDLVTIAKSLAGGFTLSGVVGKESLLDSVCVGGLGGTYAGNPIACEAALAVLDVIEDEHLVENSESLGKIMSDKLCKISNVLSDRYVVDVRGLGSMMAIEIFDGDGDQNRDLTARIVKGCLDQKLILLTCGSYGNVIRFLPPLNTPEEVLNRAMSILSDVMFDLMG